jgi:molybdate transport system substrate-binding protein
VNPFRRHILQFAAASLAVAMLAGAPAHAQERVMVFAAASLKNALDAANAAWTAKSSKAAVVSYAASSALAKQIEAGAPADVFISADLDWMDYLEQHDLIQPRTRANLLGNRIVLIAPASLDTPNVKIEPGFPLAAMLGDERIAMGEVNSVPAGKYGKEALEKLGVWDEVKDKVAGAENVRAALALVAQAEARLGIVYETDALADESVETIGVFPEDSHPPIIYPIAVTTDAANPDAEAYVAFLKSTDAAPFFEAEGFTVLADR